MISLVLQVLASAGLLVAMLVAMNELGVFDPPQDFEDEARQAAESIPTGDHWA